MAEVATVFVEATYVRTAAATSLAAIAIHATMRRNVVTITTIKNSAITAATEVLAPVAGLATTEKDATTAITAIVGATTAEANFAVVATMIAPVEATRINKIAMTIDTVTTGAAAATAIEATEIGGRRHESDRLTSPTCERTASFQLLKKGMVFVCVDASSSLTSTHRYGFIRCSERQEDLFFSFGEYAQARAPQGVQLPPAGEQVSRRRCFAPCDAVPSLFASATQIRGLEVEFDVATDRRTNKTFAVGLSLLPRGTVVFEQVRDRFACVRACTV
jgi:hypothetical protein